jgi:molybdopterin/thiamine biosynthesis adenylyltransferase
MIRIKALANEVAKNLVLAGIGSLTIIDHEQITEDDLSAQFFVSEADIGKNACKPEPTPNSLLMEFSARRSSSPRAPKAKSTRQTPCRPVRHSHEAGSQSLLVFLRHHHSYRPRLQYYLHTQCSISNPEQAVLCCWGTWLLWLHFCRSDFTRFCH